MSQHQNPSGLDLRGLFVLNNRGGTTMRKTRSTLLLIVILTVSAFSRTPQVIK